MTTFNVFELRGEGIEYLVASFGSFEQASKIAREKRLSAIELGIVNGNGNPFNYVVREEED